MLITENIIFHAGTLCTASVNRHHHSLCQGRSWKVFLHSVQPSTYRSSRNRTMVSRDYSKGGITGEMNKRVLTVMQVFGYFWRVSCNKIYQKDVFITISQRKNWPGVKISYDGLQENVFVIQHSHCQLYVSHSKKRKKNQKNPPTPQNTTSRK